MPIRELMTSPSEKSSWRTSRLLDPLSDPRFCFSNNGVILGALAADYARTGSDDQI